MTLTARIVDPVPVMCDMQVMTQDGEIVAFLRGAVLAEMRQKVPAVLAYAFRTTDIAAFNDLARDKSLMAIDQCGAPFDWPIGYAVRSHKGFVFLDSCQIGSNAVATTDLLIACRVLGFSPPVSPHRKGQRFALPRGESSVYYECVSPHWWLRLDT